jgi:hypothetical protein
LAEVGMFKYCSLRAAERLTASKNNQLFPISELGNAQRLTAITGNRHGYNTRQKHPQRVYYYVTGS